MTKQQDKSLFRSIIQISWTTRAYFLCLIIFTLLDQYYDRWAYLHISSNFFITFLQYQLWRFVINFLYQPNLIMTILLILHLGYYLPKFEKQNGSIVTFYEIITIGLLIQFFTISYEAMIYLLNDNSLVKDWKVTFNIGASGVLINMLFKFLYFNVKQFNRKCSKRALFTYFYPILLIVIATMLCQQYRIDMITAYILAFIQCTCFKGGILFYTPDTYTQKQKVIHWCRLPRIPCCNWANLNEQKIKPNRLMVVQAHNFYVMKAYQPAYQGPESSSQFPEPEMQTQRGKFRDNGARMFNDDLRHEGKGEKWERQQIIQDE